MSIEKCNKNSSPFLWRLMKYSHPGGCDNFRRKYNPNIEEIDVIVEEDIQVFTEKDK